MNFEMRLKEIIEKDDYIMTILRTVESLKLEDSWVCAGLIRNKVWDILHNLRTPINDIDVIYFDALNTSKEKEKLIEKKLETLVPDLTWSVKNQARMHSKNGVEPYSSSYEGVAHFPETPTAVAVKIQKDELVIMAPYGLNDLFEKIVRPTPIYMKNKELYKIYQTRMNEKQWEDIWRMLVVK
ncbi:nucleotidyltransferase family protein [Rummeliibacillus sp. JY-2-4R]